LLGALTPCVFVAKSEVKAWPIFGWFARMAGTIFVNRNSRRDVTRANEEIRAALGDGALVVLFAEGTSSDGTTVLPFKSSLLEAAIGERVPITVGALQYQLPGGDARRDVCYWGEQTLLRHLVNLMSKQGVQASVAFSEVTNTWRDRKKLAAQLHARVSFLHSELRRTSFAVDRQNSLQLRTVTTVEQSACPHVPSYTGCKEPSAPTTNPKKAMTKAQTIIYWLPQGTSQKNFLT
jgi:1-acyl-sn-glycerol-3-phosphate acyltransferase